MKLQVECTIFSEHFISNQEHLDINMASGLNVRDTNSEYLQNTKLMIYLFSNNAA